MITVFDFLKDIITTKTGKYLNDPDFEQSFSKIFIIKYLSCHPKYVFATIEAGKYLSTLSNENMYLYLIKTVPYDKSSYIKYIKKNKKDAKTSE